MKVIICGAGQVGFHIAKYLAAENNDVTVIDQSEELVRKISDTLEVKGIIGFGSHPDVLQQAGAEEADMLIAVTFADEVNMTACQVAHSLFNVPTKIARIRSQTYLQPEWASLFGREKLPIDVVISPEMEVARAVARRLQAPGAFDMIPFADDKVKILGIRCSDDCPVINTPLRQLHQLFPDLNISILGMIRGDKAVYPKGDDQMLAGDLVYLAVSSDQVDRAMSAFGHEDPEARRIVIFGGGNIALFLAEEINKNFPGVTTRLVEADPERARYVAQKLPKKSVVLRGDVLDPELLEEANVGNAEAVVALTNDDETNILASLLAKRYGCPRALTLINKSTYNSLVSELGVDVVISPRMTTVSTILHHVRRGRIRAVHSLSEGFGEVLEAEALETAPIVGKAIKDIAMPASVVFGAILRDGEVVMPRAATVIEANDRIVVFAGSEQIKKVEKMFAVRLEYF
ncbi:MULTISPECIES: Trk system potassium transporter TrkA [Thalassospira]|jgi:trk system potassium uptake protein TrkA|uniref:Trk system potassium uptake protein TrkA n=3 Tax=Thalassospira TaxID=168934 RepID=A0A853KYP3_9PROT|nr:MULTISPECIES: Trk system potassium transporter TrkA [Thalassospira]KXJ58531.1 MAG: potassium transporter TrkA [Thalassospira sp. Nap_22]OAZ13256.1 potassium transporter TrkA [Thalassospira profundimaris]AXO14997.1 Trk system potassium transporter TrkA [Thalassospira indica]EKF07512.1 potassium transporter peripheral membrane component [Thalassospira profundimaris WP0211]KZC97824.1 potassium transporter TrkA [Thalassospira sp. MCCC 1A02898]|tara:strand:+ start:905 stop:2284 length:1380 start_codon:yes stop_codon:yes gene_type:complete